MFSGITDVTTEHVERQAILADESGQTFSIQGIIELTAIPNCNIRYPLEIHIQEKCNMGEWHTVSKCVPELWDN